MEKKTEIEYQMIDGFQMPNLVMENQVELKGGRYSKMRLEYLNSTALGRMAITKMMFELELTKHLNRVQEEAEESIRLLIKQMAMQEQVTEEMKIKDMLEWVGAMNNIKARAEEIVIAEIVLKEVEKPTTKI